MMRSVLQFTGGFLLLVLIMLGVGGTIYKLIAPEGWLAQLLGGSLNYLSAIALALVGVGMFAWFAQDQIAQTRRTSRSTAGWPPRRRSRRAGSR